MTEDRLDALERRLQLVEDQLAITRVVLAYGPRVDSGCAEAVADLWAEDGSYEFQADAAPLSGREEQAGMVRSAAVRTCSPRRTCGSTATPRSRRVIR